MQTASAELVRVRMITVPLPDASVFDPEPQIDEDLITLGNEAEKLLGYHELKRKVDSPHDQWKHKKWSMNYHWEKVCERVSAENHLAEVLAELEIDVLDLDSVNRYKEAHLQELVKPKHTGRFAWLLNAFEYQEEYIWQRVSMERYNLPIPSFVVNKAVQIKKRLPKAVFWIEECVDRRTIRVEDPFLVVDYDGKLHSSGRAPHNSTYGDYVHVERYIEVWDEPKFEAGL